jgi:hypothetical protein
MLVDGTSRCSTGRFGSEKADADTPTTSTRPGSSAAAAKAVTRRLTRPTEHVPASMIGRYAGHVAHQRFLTYHAYHYKNRQMVNQPTIKDP